MLHYFYRSQLYVMGKRHNTKQENNVESGNVLFL